MRLALAAALCFAALAAPAHAVSIYDRDIGWPETLRKELRLERPATRDCEGVTREAARRQARVDARDPFEAFRAIFRYRWGSAWFDHCDHGRLKVGVVRTAAVRSQLRRARALVARRGLTRDVRFVAVRSTYRELGDEQHRIGEAFSELYARGHLISSTDTSRNAVEFEVARPVSEQDVRRLRAAAKASPVNVVVRRVPEDDLSVEPLR